MSCTLGTPSDIADKVANDFDAHVTIKEKCGMINYTSGSKYQPMNVNFKWDEEYKLQIPWMPGQTWTVR